MFILTKIRLRNYIYKRLTNIKAGNLITSWSCYDDNLKECYEVLKTNPDITLKEYLKEIDWSGRDKTKYNIYSFNINDDENSTDNQ